jgi:beta-mannanase
LSRSDVPNSGWIYEFDSESIPDGRSNVSATSYTAQGAAIASAQLELIVDNAMGRASVDAPGVRAPVHGKLDVTGWALAREGIAKVEIHVNGNFVHDANYGEVRRDVASAFPEYQTENVGFRSQIDFDRLRLPRGFHRLEIVVLTAQGKRRKLATSEFFYTPGRIGIGYVDRPSLMHELTELPGLRVSGWLEGEMNSQRVDVFLNDRWAGRSSALVINRPDVSLAFPSAKNVQGFDFSIPDFAMTGGANRVTVVATNPTGLQSNIDAFTGPMRFGIASTSTLVGAHLRPQNDYDKSIKQYTQEVGIQPQIVMYFQPWKTQAGACAPFNIYPYLPERVSQNGAIPMITWEPLQEGVRDQSIFRYENILAGVFDTCIRAYAQDVKDFRTTVLIRFGHEMNGNSNSWTGIQNANNPDAYVRVYRRIVDIFKEVGAENARFVWSPDHASPSEVPAPSNDFRNYYPGDGYVDFIGVSGYNWGNDPIRGGGWVAPRALFTTFLDVIKREYPGKPVILAEVGSVKSTPTNSRKQWIRDLFEFAKNRPEVKAIVWFNDFAFAQTDLPDFRIANSPGFPAVDPSETTAFREAADVFLKSKH